MGSVRSGFVEFVWVGCFSLVWFMEFKVIIAVGRGVGRVGFFVLVSVV